MRRVLALAYHFPPVGGAGVQRTVKFVRYLPELGYDCTVVTGRGETGTRWTPRDTSLAAETAGARVVRIPAPEPTPSDGWRSRRERWLGARTPFSSWWIDGCVAAGRAAEADLVYASMSPYESGEAAAWLARERRLPWVADLRDPWALDEMLVYPTRVHRLRALARMRSVLSSASAVVMNTPEAAGRAERLLGPAGPPVVSIPNGFDPEDFAQDPDQDTDGGGPFQIVHAGYLHTELGQGERARRLARRLLGGGLHGAEILTRSHVYLVAALDRLLASVRLAPGDVELHLAGVASGADEAAGRRPYVRFHGYLDHESTIALLRSADLLFLPMHNLPPGRRAGIVPGKTYEYLASGRPILAAVPDGDARELLERAGTASIVRPDDVAGMERAVLAAVAGRRARLPGPALRPGVLVPYERRRLAGELAAVFDRVLGNPARPAAARTAEALAR